MGRKIPLFHYRGLVLESEQLMKSFGYVKVWPEYLLRLPTSLFLVLEFLVRLPMCGMKSLQEVTQREVGGAGILLPLSLNASRLLSPFTRPEGATIIH